MAAALWDVVKAAAEPPEDPRYQLPPITLRSADLELPCGQTELHGGWALRCAGTGMWGRMGPGSPGQLEEHLWENCTQCN